MISVSSPSQFTVAAPAAGIALIKTGSGTFGNAIDFYDGSGTLRHSIYDNYGVSGMGAGDLVIHPNPGILNVDGSLKVNSLTNTHTLQVTDGAATGYLLQSDASGHATWVTPTSTGAGLWAASGTEISNTNTGNIRISDNDILLRGGTDANHGLGWYGTGKLWNGATIDGPVLYGFSGGALGTTNGGQNAVLHWTSDGKVQIGNVSTPNIYNASTNTGGYSLYVEGGVLAEKYKCAIHTTSDWSDYVFDKSYQLKPLSDVEAYIKINKHLPDVPSAENVHCDGIDIAQMDATLLRKIEELTLYTLDLKKEIEILKSQIK